MFVASYESPLIRVLLLGRAHFDSRDYRPSLKRFPSPSSTFYMVPVSRRSILVASAFMPAAVCGQSSPFFAHALSLFARVVPSKVAVRSGRSSRLLRSHPSSLAATTGEYYTCSTLQSSLTVSLVSRSAVSCSLRPD